MRIKKRFKWIKKINVSFFYTFLLGLIALSILVSLVILNPFSTTSNKAPASFLLGELENQNKIKEIENLETLNAKSSEFNNKYKEFLDTDIDLALKAKKNLIVDKYGENVRVNTTYQGLAWNYTSINENNDQFFNLWKDDYLVNKYAQIASPNTFSYVATSSITEGKRCYFDTQVNQKICNDSPISEWTTYKLRDAYTSYPDTWLMNDIFNEEKVKSYLMNNSVHNDILGNRNNDYPYVYLWGDKEIYTTTNARIASGNHLTYYLNKQLTNVTLSFKARFYGHLLAKSSNDSPFQIIATSDGDLLDVNINLDSVVALRIISSPDIDKRRGLLYKRIIDQYSSPNTINELFEEKDDYNRLFLYYLTISKNNNVLVPKKVNNVSIGINRLLFDEKDIDFGLRSGIYSRLKDTYLNSLYGIGFLGYDINFTPNKKRLYEESWFNLFKNGKLNQANRYFVEFLPISYQVSKTVITPLSSSAAIPFNKPFGWKKNTRSSLAASKLSYDYENDFLLTSYATYGDKDYDVYRNPPMLNYNVLLGVIVDFVVNRFYSSLALQIQSHFVSLFLEWYQPFATNDEKEKYVNLATLFANVFFKLLTSSRQSLSMATIENTLYPSYYENNKRLKIFDSYSNTKLAGEIISSMKKNLVSLDEMLEKDTIRLLNNQFLTTKKGWRAGNIDEIELPTSKSFVESLINILDEFSINDLNDFFTKSTTFDKNENLLLFLSSLILLNKKSILYQNTQSKFLLEDLRLVNRTLKSLSKPTDTIELNTKYVKSPNVSDKDKNTWVIGRIFDLSKSDDQTKNLLTTYYNTNRKFSYNPVFLPTWSSPATISTNRFLPDKYKGNDQLSKEVQKGYQFMENKLVTNYLNFSLVLGENEVGLKFLKSIINTMRARNFIGGQNSSFVFYNSIPEYKFSSNNKIEKIVRCPTNVRFEVLAPKEGEWCGVGEDSLNFNLDQFQLVNGLEYMSFVNTESFMSALANAFSKEYFLDPITPFHIILKTIMTYFWYLSI